MSCLKVCDELISYSNALDVDSCQMPTLFVSIILFGFDQRLLDFLFFPLILFLECAAICDIALINT